MPFNVTICDEYKMLIDELRQNRLIQLQALAATPVWLGVFFGLVGARGQWSAENACLLLVPIPLVFVSVLLILDRRGSSDFILGYIRTAIDQQLADRPGWNFLLPEFRRRFAAMPRVLPKGASIPQRFDFNLIVVISFLLMSLTCCALFGAVAHALSTAVVVSVIVLVGYALAVNHIFVQARRKGRILRAWEETLRNRPVLAAERAPATSRETLPNSTQEQTGGR